MGYSVLCSVTSHMASLGVWTLPFCSLAQISPAFCSVVRFPSSQRPCFASEGMSTEWVLFPLQRRPLQQRDGRGFMLVAADVVHGRQPSTTCRRRYTSEHCFSRLRTCFSRLRTAGISTHETRDQVCWSRTLPVAIQPREGADPSITDQTCLLCATPAC